MLDADRQADLSVIEAVVHAVRDRAVVEQRRENFVDRREHGLLAAHVQEGRLLARERRVREILGRRGRAHRDAVAALRAERAVRAGDLVAEPRGQLRVEHGAADLGSRARQCVDVFDVEIVEQLRDPPIEPVVAQKVAIGVDRGRETVGHANSEPAE